MPLKGTGFAKSDSNWKCKCGRMNRQWTNQCRCGEIPKHRRTLGANRAKKYQNIVDSAIRSIDG